MKKFFIVAIIVALIFIGFKVKQWYDDGENQKANQAMEILKLKGTVQEDSVTKSVQAMTIEEGAQVQSLQKKNIRSLQKKYNSKTDSYTKLQASFDSLRADAGSDTVVTEVDSLDSNIHSFNNDVGNGWFGISGKINTQFKPLTVFDLLLVQNRPIFMDISIERVSSGEFVTFVSYEPEFLVVGEVQTIKVIDPRTFWEKLDLVLGLGYPAVGAGFKYESISAMYLRTFDSHGFLLTYYQNFAEIF